MQERKKRTKLTRANSDRGLNRTMHGTIRAVKREAEEGENSIKSRTYELSFSSEEPYMRWFGPEILSHDVGAVDLSRLNDIGVLLFNHNRDKVLGRITRAWIEDGRGKATVEFDTDEDAEKIRKKVESGTLQGVSVGYEVGSWEEVEAGHKSGDGKFQGPCSIARNWMPYEISIVSIPADATVGVGRSTKEDYPTRLKLAERQMSINKNMMKVR